MLRYSSSCFKADRINYLVSNTATCVHAILSFTTTAATTTK